MRYGIKKVKKNGKSGSEEVALFRPRARAVSAMIVDYNRFVMAQRLEEENGWDAKEGRGWVRRYVQSLIAFLERSSRVVWDNYYYLFLTVKIMWGGTANLDDFCNSLADQRVEVERVRTSYDAGCI